MELPFFYEENLPNTEKFVLSEVSSKHIVQVLRMVVKEKLRITNGKGQMLTTEILNINKKSVEVLVINRSFVPKKESSITIAISLIKNKSRFEWFLEKATETGVTGIIPFISKHTEKQSFNLERAKSILVSAMLQSQQSWVPEISEPVKLRSVIENSRYETKLIAHCFKTQKNELNKIKDRNGNSIILIGPEGDFSEDEVEMAIQNKFIPISLGETRLRTETAGIVAAVLLINK